MPQEIIRNVRIENLSSPILTAQILNTAGYGTNHSSLINLDADDHLQYFNEERGDDRYALKSLIGQPNGIASLDANGLIPATQLPGFVDDVEEYADVASFPTTGETGKLYVDLSEDTIYRWSGTTYIQTAGVNEMSLADVSTFSTDTTKSTFTLSENTKVLFNKNSGATQPILSIDNNLARVGIGVANPNSKLHVVGKVKIVDGTQGYNKILTSDENGLASWAAPQATIEKLCQLIDVCVPCETSSGGLSGSGNLNEGFPNDGDVLTWDGSNEGCWRAEPIPEPIPFIYTDIDAQGSVRFIVPNDNTIFGDNIISADSKFSIILGGVESIINTSEFSSILNGVGNDILSQSHYSTILGGAGNTIDNSSYSTILGGTGISITNGDYSIVGGNFVESIKQNTFIWSDGDGLSSISRFQEVADNSFNIHATGGLRLVDGNEQSGYVLTCDANGTGHWEDLPAIPDFTLFDISQNSTSSAQSTYTLTNNIPVKFQDSSSRPLLYIDETNQSVSIGTTNVSTAQDTKLYIEGNSGGSGGRTAFKVKNTNVSSAAMFALENSAGQLLNAQCSSSGYTTGAVGSIGTNNGLTLQLTTDGQTSSGGTAPIVFSPGGYNNISAKFSPDGKFLLGGDFNPQTTFHLVGGGQKLNKLWTPFSGTTMLFEQGDITKNSDFSIISNRNKIAGIFFGDEDDQNPGSILYDNATDSLKFGTNNVWPHVTIDSSGQMGIGTDTPDSKLHVKATAISGRETLFKGSVSDAGDDAFYIGNGTSGGGRFMPRFAGYVDSINTGYSQTFWGMTDSANDTSDSSSFGLTHFATMVTNNPNDPTNGTLTNPINRKLFTFGSTGPNDIHMTIAASGNVGIGTGTPSSPLHVSEDRTVIANGLVSGTAPSLLVSKNGTTVNSTIAAGNTFSNRPVFQGRRARGTIAAPSAVINNDYLMSFVSSGYDGSASQFPAAIDFFADGNTSSGNVPARISFSTGSNTSSRLERLTIKSDGKVGIGTTTPSSKLEVAGQVKITGGNPQANYVLTSDATGLASWQPSGGGSVGNLQTVTDNGNTTTNPVQFNIGGSGQEFIKFNATASSGRPLTFYDNGSFVGGIDYNFIGNYWSFDVADSTGNRVMDAFTIQSETDNNYVGIGTTAPTSQLHINSDDTEALRIYCSDNTTTNTNAGIRIMNKTGVAGGYASLSFGKGTTENTRARMGAKFGSDGTSGSYVFLTRTIAGVLDEKMVISSEGDVGIGTSSPSSKLEVAGQIKITGGNPGAGKVLTSDATGLASWQSAVTGGGPIAINDLTDVDTSTTAPNNGESLVWNSTTSKWEPSLISGGIGGVGTLQTVTDNGSITTNTITIEPTAISGREELLKGSVSDAGDDAFYLGNGTSTNSSFVPRFAGYVDSFNSKPSCQFWGLTSSANDTSDSSNTGLINFAAGVSSNATDPTNGSLTPAINRKLMTFGDISGNTNHMTIVAGGNVGFNNDTPKARVDVIGRMRFQETNDVAPTSGAGFEAFHKNSKSYFISVDRDSSNDDLREVNFFGNQHIFHTGTSLANDAPRVKIVDDGLEVLDRIKLLNPKDGSPAFRSLYSGSANFRIQSSLRNGSQNTSFNIDAVGQPGDNDREVMVVGYFQTPNRYKITSNALGTGALHPIHFEMGWENPRMVIATDGNIGIGTTSPDKALNITGSGTQSTIKITDDGTGSAAAEMYIGTSDGWSFFNERSTKNFNIRETHNSGSLVNEDRLTINQGGNIGIGTTTPTAKLEINGQIKITGGKPGTGKVLTSDAGGTASWQEPTGGTGGETAASPTAETSFYIDAGAMLVPESGASPSGVIDHGTNNAIDWWNVDTNEELFSKVAMPPQWDGGDIDVEFFWTSDGANAGDNVRWAAAATGGGNGDIWDAAFSTVTETADDLLIANGNIHVVKASGITPAGTTDDGNILFLKLKRTPTSGQTASVDARLLGVRVHYKNVVHRSWYVNKMGAENEEADTTVLEKTAFVAADAGIIYGVHSGVSTAPSNAGLSVDVKINGISILSTLGVIGAAQNSSESTSSTPHVLATNPTTFSKGDRISFEISSFGGTGGNGLHTDLLISWAQ